MIRFVRFSLVPGLIMLPGVVWPTAEPAIAASARAASPLPIFNPVLPRLAHARIPVYLPSWLPPYRVRVYPFATVLNRGAAYSVSLSTSRTGGADANLVFTLDATQGSPDTLGRAVRLPGGVIAHIDPHTGGNRGPTIAWAIGRTSYEIGYLSPDSQLVRAARSMVRVRFRPPTRPARDRRSSFQRACPPLAGAG